ncbi:o-succinylbenzoate--CoA ligase [Pseudalkalibacillus salsuginis]|uniref:o-succinylbenzoate--CoA ligase n=1 Tax=Pseudalkalibacillus salsuginis TaxID=2910972 RepID=UPI001F170620|nr:o-succinylbenzoate--CoA ligase [Pseudalkalibacillus salsuginis]MCF6408897.1 o-succinylbenzoate--CoA ligase [Pseudalkalibacillus salsuginis]
MAELEMKNWLSQRAFLTPDRTALVFENRDWTYRELNESVESIARKLLKRGLEKGQHIGFLMDNHPDTIILLHAFHLIHVVAVPLNKRLSESELDYQLHDAEVDWLIVDVAHLEKAQRLRFGKIVTMMEIKEVNETNTELDKVIYLGNLHSIIFTSGTTGYPKGVMLTFGNHWWSATGSALNLGIRNDDCWLCAVPLFHVSGLSIVMRSVIYGIPMVLHRTFEPVAFNESIYKEGVTIASVVSVMLSKALDSDNFRPYPGGFRCMLLGGGPAPFPLLKRCEVNNIPVFQTYGLSESASQIVTLAPEDSFRKLGSAGKPLFPSQVKIVSGEGDGTSLEGEIFVKGPNVTQGYFNKHDINAEKIQDGWLATGDVGYLDDDGFLYVLDRRNDMFISGGENVYPAEIEACLLGHETVAEAGVIGIDDAVWGKVPAAFVVLKDPDVSEEALIQYCKEHLASYKVPKIVRFIKVLPRNASNKILRKDLHSLLEEGDENAD